MKEEILKKWLNDELSAEELKSFKQTNDYHSYVKILENAKYFKAPQFDEKSSLEGLNFAIKSKKKSSNNTAYQLIAAISAIFIIGFFVYKYAFVSANNNQVNTTVAQIENVELPDHSQVSLNANSSLFYDKQHWEDERLLQLDGEALFEVEKGKKFKVNTPYGFVEVLGTVFNVKSRDYKFEVHCFEGSVSVNVNEGSYILKKNDKLVFANDKVVINQEKAQTPDWKSSLSKFESQELSVVLKEFKNYYDVDFETSDINTNKIFTGSFSHQNIEIALNSITLPLGLSYKIDGKTVFLSNK
jgi:ferric-dicitrate binding protein FerR (iron transport regulator)